MMGVALWWAGLGVVVVGVFPAVAVLALRIIRSLGVIQRAAVDIRSSLGAVASGIPPAVAALSDVAMRCERLADRVPV